MPNNKGFTLVELAIVLIIIGLITGGVVGANSLIESANRQSVIRDFTNYVNGIRAYKLEYDALPGDHIDAESYFGASNTDNGNGDKFICCYGESRGGRDVEPEGPVWNHLALADIVPGEFYSSFGDFIDGAVGPESPVGKHWQIQYASGRDSLPHFGRWGCSDACVNLYDRKTGHFLTIDADATGDDEVGVLNAKNSRAIDKKIDDGEPELGNYVAVRRSGSSSCVDTDETSAWF